MTTTTTVREDARTDDTTENDAPTMPKGAAFYLITSGKYSIPLPDDVEGPKTGTVREGYGRDARHWIGRPGDAIPADLMTADLWNTSHTRFVPIDASGELVEPEDRPLTEPERAAADFRERYGNGEGE